MFTGWKNSLMVYYFSSLYERLSFLHWFDEFPLKFVLLCCFLENCKYIENMQGFYAILLLIVSNVFMTFAWYGHLKLQEMKWIDNWPLFGVILFSWSIALLEYCAQVPANRLGFIGNGGPFSLMQLKVVQEVITLTIFIIFSMLFFKGVTFQWNHLAACVCLVLAVYFVFMK